MTQIRRYPQVAFLALAVLVNVLASAAVRLAVSPGRLRVVETAAVFDMTLTVTALYYFLVVRPGIRPKASLAVVAFLGLLRASFAFPAVVPGRELLLAAGEVALVSAVVVGLRRSRSLSVSEPDADPLDRLRAVLSGLLPSDGLARVLVGELVLLQYAFTPNLKPHVPAGATPFTLHKRAAFNDLILGLALVSLLEVVPVHLVASHWSHTAAWILTGLSLYGGMAAFALSRSFDARPCYLAGDRVVLRFGLIFTLVIPLDQIAGAGTEPVADALVLPRNTEPQFYLTFRAPLRAERMFGMSKTVRAVGLSTDEFDLRRFIA